MATGSEGLMISLDESGKERLGLTWAVCGSARTSTIMPISLMIGHSEYPADIGNLAELRPDIQKAVELVYGQDTAKAIDVLLERGEYETGGPVLAWGDIAPGVQVGSSKTISSDTELGYANELQGKFKEVVDGEPVEVSVYVDFQTRRQEHKESLIDGSSSINFIPSGTTALLGDLDLIKGTISQADIKPLTRAVTALVHLAETNAFCDKYLESGELETVDDPIGKMEEFSVEKWLITA